MRLNNPAMLRVLLEDREMSQGRLGRYAGCSKGFVSHLVAGRKKTCTPQLAERIAEALGVPMEFLFTEPVSPTKQPSVNRKVAAA